MIRRLVGEITNLQGEECPYPSTPVAKVHSVMINTSETHETMIKSMSTVAISKRGWTSLTAADVTDTTGGSISNDSIAKMIYRLLSRVSLEGTAHRTKERKSTKTSIITDQKSNESNFTKMSEVDKTNPRALEQSVAANKTESHIDNIPDSETKSSSNEYVQPPKVINSERALAPQVDAKTDQETQKEVRKTDEVGVQDLDPDIVKALKEFNITLNEMQLEKELLDLDIEDAIFLHVVDAGGQPSFMEMMPMITVGPALYLVFLNLNEDLHQRFDTTLRRDPVQKSVCSGESTHTVREVIQQIVSSIVCFRSTSESIPGDRQIDPELKDIVSKQKQAVVLFGTHKDLLSSPEAEIEKKDKVLRGDTIICMDYPSENPIKWYKGDEECIFPVSNMTGDKKEVKEIQEFLEDQLRTFSALPIPPSWLMFSLFLRKLQKDILTMKECETIARRFKVEDLGLALWFLHHFIGVPLHYDEGELCHLVICNPQVVFDSISEIIITGLEMSHTPGIRKNFNNKGTFFLKEVEDYFNNRLRTGQLKTSITPSQLVQILLLHNFIALVRSGHTTSEEYVEGARDTVRGVEIHRASKGTTHKLPAQPHKNDEYFMPARLNFANDNDLKVECNPTDPVPLIICFKCGIIPVGVFCATVARLVSVEWELSPLTTQKRNKITFRMNGVFDIILISKPKCYEIHIVGNDRSTPPTAKICNFVLNTMCEALDHVLEKMENLKNLKFRSGSTPDHYQLGLYCPINLEDDHLAVCACEGTHSLDTKLSAKDLWLSEKKIMKCSKLDCKVMPKDWPLDSYRYRRWFSQNSEESLPGKYYDY